MRIISEARQVCPIRTTINAPAYPSVRHVAAGTGDVKNMSAQSDRSTSPGDSQAEACAPCRHFRSEPWPPLILQRGAPSWRRHSNPIAGPCRYPQFATPLQLAARQRDLCEKTSLDLSLRGLEARLAEPSAPPCRSHRRHPVRKTCETVCACQLASRLARACPWHPGEDTASHRRYPVAWFVPCLRAEG